jgi:pyridoxamine 5'-phosphate oxidase family protein
VSEFSDTELAYLAAQPGLARLATIGPDGLPHVVPLGWRYNPDLDCIDIHGRNLANTKKFRNVTANPAAALLIDDVLPPWRPRAVMIRGHAEALVDEEADANAPVIRLSPAQVLSWGTDQRP